MKRGISFLQGKTLTTQIIIILTAIMLVPLVALFYDIFFGSKTNEVIFLDKELRLEALVKSTNEDFGKELLSLALPANQLTSNVLTETFHRVVQPQVPANSGIRFGLYIPGADRITVLGFLHNYRNLSPSEGAERERQIFEMVKPGLVATQMSKQPLFRITGTRDDQIVEYISPVLLQNEVVGVMWAEERLNPILTQSSYIWKLIRYFILMIMALGIIGTLLVVRNITTGVDRLKLGLQRMEEDIHHLLPEMSGELGQVAVAVNKMAVGLAEKKKLEDQLRRSEHLIALGRLVTGVAHELRNPIGIIKTLVELMKEEYSQVSGVEEFTKAIDEQVERQNAVIHELLEFGRPTKGLIRQCSINDLIKGVLSFSAALLRKQHIKVNLDLEEELPFLMADAEKLKQVFVNLIINSAEAMPNGG